MSTSSLYGITGNVVVSSNNVTTLYNATGGNIVTANVPDRDFTTLYTNQTTVNPTYAYGNSNVEAFLNAGTDGANIVQNINADGNITANNNLTINGISNLGPASNVHITGGNLNYVLQTDGTGNLSWVAQIGANANVTPYTHFNVTATGNGQQFDDSNLNNFANANVMAVFKNGVNIEPSLYEMISNTVLQINILLNAGDTIDVLPSAGGGSGSTPGGNLTEIQYNGGPVLSGNASFTFDQPNSLMTVGQVSTGNVFTGDITANGIVSLGNVSNLHILGGFNGQFLSTDGGGQLAWSSTVITSINTDVANVHISGGANGYVLSTDGSNNLSWTNTVANSNYSNTSAFAENANVANLANTATIATSATTAGSATTAVNVTDPAQPNITSVGTMTGFTSNGTVDFANAASVNLGANSNVHITGGSGGQVLSTDGVGNLSWVSVVLSTPNYANFAGTIVNSSQPNITSVGTLTDLTISGNLYAPTLTTTSNGNIIIQPNGTGIIDVGGKVFQNPKFKEYSETVQATSNISGTITPDLASATIFNYTLTGNITLNSFANALAGASAVLVLTQDATGNRTLTSTMKFSGGSKVLSTAANSIDVITMFYNGTTYYASLIKGYA